MRDLRQVKYAVRSAAGFFAQHEVYSRRVAADLFLILDRKIFRSRCGPSIRLPSIRQPS